MKDKSLKKHTRLTHLKDVALLFSIPIGIAIIATLAVYVPRLLANPQHDFVYSMCADYACSDNYEVDDTGRVARYSEGQEYRNRTSELYYYSVKDDAARRLTSSQAKNYQLDTSFKSPDGYVFTQEEGGYRGLIFFGTNHVGGWYLKNGWKKKPVEVTSSDRYYSQNITFLGWVK